MEFRVTDGIVVEGDPVLLRVALENLLSNAWKFTSTTSQPIIEFGRTDADVVPTYFLSDNGVGFDPAFSEKLFQPFQRLHRENEFEGNGIGLATVQRVIDRHGGQVWAEGKPKSGAIFYFTIPQTCKR